MQKGQTKRLNINFVNVNISHAHIYIYIYTYVYLSIYLASYLFVKYKCHIHVYIHINKYILHISGFPTGIENLVWGWMKEGSSKFDGRGGLSQYMGGAWGA